MSKKITVKALIKKYDTSYGIQARLMSQSRNQSLASVIKDSGKVKGGGFVFKMNASKFKGKKKLEAYFSFKNINGGDFNFKKKSNKYLMDPNKQNSNIFTIRSHHNKTTKKVSIRSSELLPPPPPGPTPAEENEKVLNDLIGTRQQTGYVSPGGEAGSYGVILRAQNDGEPYANNKQQESNIAGSFLHNSMKLPGMTVYPYNWNYLQNSSIGFETDTATLVSVFSPKKKENENIFGTSSIQDVKNGAQTLVIYPQDANSEARAFPYWTNTASGNDKYIYKAYGYSQYTAANPATKDTYNSNTAATSDVSVYGALWQKIGAPTPPTSVSGNTILGAGAGIHAALDFDGGATPATSNIFNANNKFFPYFTDTAGGQTTNVDYADANKLWAQDSLLGYWGLANQEDLKADPKGYVSKFGDWVYSFWNFQGGPKTIKNNFDSMDFLVPWNDNIEDMITMQNNLWYNADAAYGKAMAGVTDQQKINRWQSYSEVPLDTQYASPGLDNGFAFALPAGSKSLDDFIARDPVGSQIGSTSTRSQRRKMIVDQLDLYHFGSEEGSKNPKGQIFIGENSWIYELQTLPTGVTGPNGISTYYRNFQVVDDFSVASNVDANTTYSIKDGMLDIVSN